LRRAHSLKEIVLDETELIEVIEKRSKDVHFSPSSQALVRKFFAAERLAALYGNIRAPTAEVSVCAVPSDAKASARASDKMIAPFCR